MTPIAYLEKIKKLLKSATPGPWQATRHADSQGVKPAVRTLKDSQYLIKHMGSEADSDLIAACPTELSRLVAMVEKLIEQRDWAIRHWQDSSSEAEYAISVDNEALSRIVGEK